MRILLVDDDEIYGAALKSGLTRAGYTVDWALTGEDALTALPLTNYTSLILALSVATPSGSEVLTAIRQLSNIPILIVTSDQQIEVKITALDLGADEYLIKPIKLAELLAYLRALHRRARGQSQALLKARDVEIDLATRTVQKAGIWVKVTAREFKILALLIERVGKIVSKEEIEGQVYNLEGHFDSNTVEVAIYSLRKKLGQDFIFTIRRIGYVVNE